MKVYITEKPEIRELEVHIVSRKNDPQVASIVQMLTEKQKQILVKGVDENKNHLQKIAIDDVFYIESVDKRNFIYTEASVFEIDKKLYELEGMLPEDKFIRISKSTIVNIIKIKGIEPEEGRRLKLTLNNGERVIISRNYVTVFKRQIGIRR